MNCWSLPSQLIQLLHAELPGTLSPPPRAGLMLSGSLGLYLSRELSDVAASETVAAMGAAAQQQQHK